MKKAPSVLPGPHLISHFVGACHGGLALTAGEAHDNRAGGRSEDLTASSAWLIVRECGYAAATFKRVRALGQVTETR